MQVYLCLKGRTNGKILRAPPSLGVRIKYSHNGPFDKSNGKKFLPVADLTITLIRLLTESKLKVSSNSNLKERLKTRFDDHLAP